MNTMSKVLKRMRTAIPTFHIPIKMAIWKKALLAVYVVAIVFASLNIGTAVVEAKSAFSDVSSKDWYAGAVQYV